MNEHGLDTSVLLRLLVGAPPLQAQRALSFVEAEASEGRLCLVSDLVVSEAYFALQYHYKVPKDEAQRALLKLLESGLVAPTGQSALALREAESTSSKPGFVDRMIALQYSPHQMATFEKAAARLPNARLLS